MGIVKFDADKILRDKTVVHCRTKEQAMNLCKWADSVGVKWCNGESYADIKPYYNDVCYCIFEGMHGRTKYYESEGYTILSYEEALLPEKTFPRKMLVWDKDEWEAVEATVHAIVDTLTTYPVITEGGRYNHAKELPKTPAEQYRYMTHAEVFKAIRDGAVVKYVVRGTICDFWATIYNIEDHNICYDYTGTDADVWEEMKVRV